MRGPSLSTTSTMIDKLLITRCVTAMLLARQSVRLPPSERRSATADWGWTSASYSA